MLRYLLRRLLQAVPVFLGTTFLIYFMVFAMPGNPIVALFGDKTPNPAQVAALEAQYNLDKPFFVQYLLYLKNVLHRRSWNHLLGSRRQRRAGRHVPRDAQACDHGGADRVLPVRHRSG